jgi:glycosyltransferase involved in cell wall biosynthesis
MDTKYSLSADPFLAVIIPIYNEEKTVGEIVQCVQQQKCVKEIIMVDDCSRDDTWQVLQALAAEDPRIRLGRHSVNQGKGAALRTGFRMVTAPIALIQDADLEYDPEDYDHLTRPILQGKADVVFGSRFLGSGAHRVLYFWHSMGNRFLTTLSNMFTDLNLTDMECGYKLFRKEILDRITIEENRFGFEPEINAKIAAMKVRIFEIPISYYGRTYSEGKKIGWKDGVSAIRCILKYNLLR